MVWRRCGLETRIAPAKCLTLLVDFSLIMRGRKQTSGAVRSDLRPRRRRLGSVLKRIRRRRKFELINFCRRRIPPDNWFSLVRVNSVFIHLNPGLGLSIMGDYCLLSAKAVLSAASRRGPGIVVLRLTHHSSPSLLSTVHKHSSCLVSPCTSCLPHLVQTV